jgi:hypothetical protein
MFGVILAVGCGGGSSGGFGGPGAAGSSGGAGAAANAGSGGSGGGATGGGGGGSAGIGLVTGFKVVAGPAALLTEGPSCTSEVGAAGDRWCAFVAFSTLDKRMLSVVNVSQVIAGVPVACGGGDPNCLLLTRELGRDALSPTLHGTYFQGDTLVYYDAALVPYAWRPGMTAGRRLVDFGAGAKHDAILCTPATTGTAVICLGLPATQPDPNITQAELLIGKADGANEPLLSVVETVITSTSSDIGGRPRFSFGFPPGAGDHVAWTSRAGPTGPETLKLQAAGDPASKVTVASDVHAWHVSPDGARWFWLSAIDRTGVGTLQTAPFPSGANPTGVRLSVVEYGILPVDGKTIVAISAIGTLVAIADPVAATSELVLDTNVRMLLSFSAAGHVAYTKNRVGANTGDLLVKKADGTATCIVEPTSRVPFGSVSFAPNAGAVVWARAMPGGLFDGHYTRLRDCNPMPIAPDVVVLASIGHEVVLFMDQFDGGPRSGSMRFMRVGNDNRLHPETSTPIADHVDSYAISGPAPGALLYTVNAGGEDDGVYVRWFGR